MTPNEIATNVASLNPIGDDTVALSMRGTQSFVGSTWTIDDSTQWD